jgi:hypothetical protein
MSASLKILKTGGHGTSLPYALVALCLKLVLLLSMPTVLQL